MKKGSPIRISAVGMLVCVLPWVTPGSAARGQTDPRATAQSTEKTQLLEKAHTLEVRGRMDMARQIWQQVLLVDPNNSDALAGMARAAKLEGNQRDAGVYLDKLRSINPNDPNITRVENMGTAQDTNAQLQESGRLAQAGQYARATQILRQVYGTNPPPGDAALSYYQTEAATEEGRPHAIAGLRALVDKYPQDARYQIALGKILTYNPRTRAEGRKLLLKHPSNPDASEALRQSLVWDAQNPATSGDIRAYLTKHTDQQLSTALATTTAQVAAGRKARVAAPVLTADQKASQAAFAARSAEEQQAYNALNAKHVEDAEARFKAIVANNPNDAQALAGLGYIRMSQSNFGGAISYLEQAQQDGSKDPAVAKALEDSRFYFTMQTATAALNQSDLVKAQQQFTAALHLRPKDTTAMLGLGGTLLKAQQPEAALPIFSQYAKLQPGDRAAWRGLFIAEYGAGKYNEALATDKRVPPKVKAVLLKDPDYLRTLASVYSAMGRDTDAQRVLRVALEMPFPVDARGIQADVQLQYAALLAAAGHNEQAAGLYRQVLAGDSTNANAWVGLVQTQHTLGKDADAFSTLQSIPAAQFEQAMQEPGFETTVAAVYEGQGHDDLAQGVLEKFLAKQQDEGKKPFVPGQIQLAGIYLRQGNSAQAYPLYRSILTANPDRADAWRGLLSALHATGHDQEALAQLQQVPPAVRRDLENDPAYLQTVGSIYAGLGQPQEATAFMARATQHYTAEHMTPPADIDIQTGWLLYNSGNDAGLYRQLMQLGGRPDLTDEQRRTVQTIWTSFAVRRATTAAAHGDNKRSIAILNAAAKMFPGNPAVLKALASGYASAGMPKEAVSIFKAQDLSRGTASDYKSAVGAALAANDLRDAEMWLRFGLDQYPRDPQMLVLAAKFEQARGDSTRAAEYYRASLKMMPEADPGAELATELSRPVAQAPTRLPSRQEPQDLATLLSQPDSTTPLTGAMVQPPVPQRPYLPSYGGSGGSVPVPMNGDGMQPQQGYPAYGQGQQQQVQQSGSRAQQPRKSTVKDYLPQSRVDGEASARPGEAQPADAVAGVMQLHVSPAMEALYGPYESFVPGQEGAEGGRLVAATLGLPALGLPVSGSTASRSGRVVDGEVKLSEASFVPGQAAQQVPVQTTTADGTPVVPYAAVARPVTRKRGSAAARARAEAILQNQADAPLILSGVSHPPADRIETTQGQAPIGRLQDAQFTTAAYGAAQVAQPASAPMGSTQTGAAQAGAGQIPATQPTRGSQAPPQQTGDSVGQQYPQPGVRGATGPGSRRRTRSAKTKDVPADVPVQPQSAPLNYPGVGQPLQNPGYPAVGAPVPLGQAPTDYDLQQRNLPPLRGYFDPRIDNKTPLTERQQAELQLANIEGSSSGWGGGTVSGRYRSGTSGIDRLSALEVPFEASIVVGQRFRLTVVPRAVFLNSGQLSTTNGTLGTNPVLGTLPGNATVAPSQQFASGVGGEVQLTTGNLSGAIGVTPVQFLVSNVIGRVQWRPNAGHFTFYGGRDAVKETQLSYAGLRDPGSASPIFGGNVWGGVVQTGGGIRFDSGDEHAGLYLQADGAAITGYHVLDNRKYTGTMGAYFRVKNWPDFGSLNVGGTLFGEHYDHNERGETYGLGGYFSPTAYFLAAIPVTFNGHSGTNVHYTVNGSAGVQTFQEANQIFFPLDPGIQGGLTCTPSGLTTLTQCQSPLNSNTGLNYSIDGEASYRVNDHWYVGGFVSGNNTNNYNTISGGFFARYLMRPQYPTVDYPTGLFPVEGFRPLRVP